MTPALPAGVHHTGAAEETEALGAAVAESLRAGDLVLVRGELGAGKTTFVRGAARSLGVRGPVTSPTFTLGRFYDARIPVAHLDLFRLDGMEGEDPALLADYLRPDAIAFVEWPEVAGHRLGEVRAEIRLEHAGGDARRIEIR